jgi:hypothetical protein
LIVLAVGNDAQDIDLADLTPGEPHPVSFLDGEVEVAVTAEFPIANVLRVTFAQTVGSPRHDIALRLAQPLATAQPVATTWEVAFEEAALRIVSV